MHHFLVPILNLFQKQFSGKVVYNDKHAEASQEAVLYYNKFQLESVA